MTEAELTDRALGDIGLSETLDDFRFRVLAAVSEMESRGQVVNRALLVTAVFRARYTKEVEGKVMRDAVAHLKAALLEELGPNRSADAALKTAVLISVVAEREGRGGLAFLESPAVAATARRTPC
jgi:hypothetical protein